MTESTKQATTKKATPAAKPEFAPKVTDKGRLDHSECGHHRTLAGRSACRAEFRADATPTDTTNPTE